MTFVEKEVLRICAAFGVKTVTRGIREIYCFTRFSNNIDFFIYNGKAYKSQYLGISFMINYQNSIEYSHCSRVIIPGNMEAIPFHICNGGHYYVEGKLCQTSNDLLDVFGYDKLYKLPWHHMIPRIVFGYISSCTQYPRIVIPLIGKKLSKLSDKQLERCHSKPIDLTELANPILIKNIIVDSRPEQGTCLGLLVPFDFFEDEHGSWFLEDKFSIINLTYERTVVIGDKDVRILNKKDTILSTTPHRLSTDPPILNKGSLPFLLYKCMDHQVFDQKNLIPYYCRFKELHHVFTQPTSIICRNFSDNIKKRIFEVLVQKEPLRSLPNQPIVLYHEKENI